jgi:hypothetical protein
MRLASDDVWRESDQVIRACGGPAVAFGRHAPAPVRPQSRGPAELTKTLGILDAEGADGAFGWTFADPG